MINPLPGSFQFCCSRGSRKRGQVLSIQHSVRHPQYTVEMQRDYLRVRVIYGLAPEIYRCSPDCLSVGMLACVIDPNTSCCMSGKAKQ